MNQDWVKHNIDQNQTEVTVTENIGIYDPLPQKLEVEETRPKNDLVLEDTEDSSNKEDEIDSAPPEDWNPFMCNRDEDETV